MPFAPLNREDVEDMTDALIEEAQGLRPLIRPPESILMCGDAVAVVGTRRADAERPRDDP